MTSPRMVNIAAFDSGTGGLTAMLPLLRKHPGLSLTYFGDLANLPYGTKSPERVRELTRRNLTWLLGQSSKLGAKAFDAAVIACNTASAQALDVGQAVAQGAGVPLVGVIEATCRAAMESKAGRIVVLATSSTVQSESYLRTLQRMGSQAELVQKACPLFVPIVEENLFTSPAAEWIARHYLDSLLRPGDAVILGCTHYPFLVPLLSRLYPEVTWIETGAALLDDPLLSKVLGSALSGPTRLKLIFSDLFYTRERLQTVLENLKIDPAWTWELETVPAVT